jgi:hypothetical protein
MTTARLPPSRSGFAFPSHDASALSKSINSASVQRDPSFAGTSRLSASTRSWQVRVVKGLPPIGASKIQKSRAVEPLEEGIGYTSRDVSLTVSPASVPTQFSSYGLNANGVFEFVISGTPGTTVAVEWSADLNGWNPLVSGEIGAEGTITLEDPTDPLPDRRFYRVTGP